VAAKLEAGTPSNEYVCRNVNMITDKALTAARNNSVCVNSNIAGYM